MYIQLNTTNFAYINKLKPNEIQTTMNKTIRKNKYIAPKIIEFDMKSTTILAGSGGPEYDTSENKIDFNSSESINGS